jgi:hypothetical protein
MLAWVTMWYVLRVSVHFGNEGEGVLSVILCVILSRAGKLICVIVKVDYNVQLHVYLTIQICLANEIILASAVCF